MRRQLLFTFVAPDGVRYKVDVILCRPRRWALRDESRDPAWLASEHDNLVVAAALRLPESCRVAPVDGDAGPRKNPCCPSGRCRWGDRLRRLFGS